MALIQEVGFALPFVFLGRLENSSYVGAATVGNMLCNVTGFSLVYGASSALDTLIPQAYGAKFYRLMGLHTQRAIVIFTLAAVPIIFMWMQTGWILQNLLTLDAEISKLAQIWANYISLGLWPQIVFVILQKFLQGQQIIWPSVVASMAGIISYAVMAFVVIEVWNYRDMDGYIAVVLIMSLSQWFALFVIVLIILVRKVCIFYLKTWGNAGRGKYSAVMDRSHRGGQGMDVRDNATAEDIDEDGEEEDNTIAQESDPENNWPPFSINIFMDWESFLTLGLPGAASLFFEWGSFELVAGIAGQLGTLTLATHGIMTSTCGIFYTAPNSIAVATSTLAGNCLGENLPREACMFVYIGVFIDFCWGVGSALILIGLLREYWGKVYTDEKDLQESIFINLPIMLLYLPVDSTKCVAVTLLRNMGRPGITVTGNIISSVFLMLPLGYFLAIHLGYGLPGLWFAMSMSWVMATVLYMYVICSTEWQKECHLARERNETTNRTMVLAGRESEHKVVQSGAIQGDIMLTRISDVDSPAEVDIPFMVDSDEEDGDETLVFSISPLKV